MPDFMKGVEAFQQGSDWRQRFRANKQLEKARDLALEGGEYSMEQRRALRKIRDPDTAGVLGALDPSSVPDWGGGLEDPFAVKLMDWFKSRKGRKKAKKSAIDLGDEGAYDSSSPTGTGDAPMAAPAPDMGGAETFPMEAQPQMPMEDMNPGAEPQSYADGGGIDMEALNAKQLRQAQWEILKDRLGKLPGAARETLTDVDSALGKFTGRAAEGSGMVKGATAGLKRAGAAGALLGTALTTGSTDTEDYRKRFGMETNDPSLGGDIAARTLGAASDLGSILTFGAADRFYRDKQDQGAAPADPAAAAAPEQAIPTDGGYGGAQSDVSSRSRGGGRTALPTQAQPETADFSDLDIDPKDVPDMKTNDWVKYRAQAMDAARQSGDPASVKAAGDAVTQMQVEGFQNYGQQGLALQQAGNIRGAMAAYRAAFQYFPNGNDVEFGVHKGKSGRPQIVGVGLDEKTGKRVPGTELIMDPERVSVLLSNFKNPAAFAMWTKDHRAEQFRERQYQEVTKPLAQATADYQANNSEANILRAENAQLKAGGGGAAGQATNMRNAERAFRERVGQMGLVDEPTADFLASVMSQVKAENPSVPDNVIIQTIMTAQRDGTLAARIQKMAGGGGGGGGAAPTQAAPPTQAIPTDEGDAGDPAMAGLSPEEVEWANRPAQ
jgi:hypothetical protein